MLHWELFWDLHTSSCWICPTEKDQRRSRSMHNLVPGLPFSKSVFSSFTTSGIWSGQRFILVPIFPYTKCSSYCPWTSRLFLISSTTAAFRLAYCVGDFQRCWVCVGCIPPEPWMCESGGAGSCSSFSVVLRGSWGSLDRLLMTRRGAKEEHRAVDVQQG